MGVKKKWSELTPEQKRKIEAIMEEQEEEDIELGDDPEETDEGAIVGTKKENGRRILVIEGPDVDHILKSLGIDEDEVEDDDDGDEVDPVVEEKPKRRSTKKKEEEEEEEIEEPKEEPKPPSRSRYFGGR